MEKGKEENVEKVDALGRKVWDRNFYTEKAIGKSGGGDVVEETISTLYQGTFKKPVITVPEVREDLKPRTETIDFSKFVGRSELVDVDGPKSKQGGFFCKTCNCLLKDSQSYLDHLNGKKHNRLLGMTMRVEKVSAKTVADKLRRLSERDSSSVKTKEELENDARERIKELEMYEKELKEKRRLMKLEKKKRKLNHDSSSDYNSGHKVKSERINVKSEYKDFKSDYDDGVKSEYKVKSEYEDQEESSELEAMRKAGLPVSFC
uniref:Zinc-finger of C2H2 type/Zinc-finger double-stranded RNA-binding, putative n=1 Tax=Theileria annulata TaxID=5874 RepID=A0A3B0MVJ4_THEAN